MIWIRFWIRAPWWGIATTVVVLGWIGTRDDSAFAFLWTAFAAVAVIGPKLIDWLEDTT